MSTHHVVFLHCSLNVLYPTVQQIPMASYPLEPMYDAYGKPLGPSEYPHVGYPMQAQYPGMPPQYPVMHPGPYPPHLMDPAYSQGKISTTSQRDSDFLLNWGRKGCKMSCSWYKIYIFWLVFLFFCSCFSSSTVLPVSWSLMGSSPQTPSGK